MGAEGQGCGSTAPPLELKSRGWCSEGCRGRGEPCVAQGSPWPRDTCTCSCPIRSVEQPSPWGQGPAHPTPGCPSHDSGDPGCCSALSLSGGTTKNQSRLFRSVIFRLRQGATQTDKLQIKRVPHSTPALAVNSPVVQFPALRACQFQLIAGGTKTLCPDSPGSRHP